MNALRERTTTCCLRLSLAFAFGAACWMLLVSRSPAADWPQVAGSAARTGHTSDEPRPPYKLLWNKTWDGEVFTNTNQPIIVSGVLYVAGSNGVVHAVQTATGKDMWTADVDGPVTHTLASDGERVFAATLAGTVHALGAGDGKEQWKAKVSRRGFSAAPLLMDVRTKGGEKSALLIGNRDGWFYALSSKNGTTLWKVDTGAPIRQTAAGADGKVVFVNDAMAAICLDAATGQTLWQSEIPGGSVRDYWPVIHKGRVVIRTAEAGGRGLLHLPETLQKRFFWPPAKNGKVKFKARTEADVVGREQDMLVEYFREFPFVRTFVVLNLADGTEPYVAGVYGGCSNTGTYVPPVVAGDGNMYCMSRTSAADSGFINITHLYLGRFDVETGRMARPILCGWRDVGQTLFGIKGPLANTSSWKMISDETVALSSGGNLVFGMRSEGGAGAVDVRTKEHWPLPGFSSNYRTDIQSSANVLSISGKYVAYTTCLRNVVCIEGN